MTLPALATTEQLAARIPGGIAAGDGGRAQAALEDASTAIRAYAGKTWATGDAVDFGDMAPELQDELVRICLAVAKRSFTNPGAVKSTTTGPFGVAFADSSPDVYLKATEKDVIRKAAGRSGLTTISMTREDRPGASDFGRVVDGTVYADVEPDGEPLPWLDEDQLG